MSKEDPTRAEMEASAAELRAGTARLRGVHARMVADRHREEVAGERRLRLSLVPPPAKGRKAPKPKARTHEEFIADCDALKERTRALHARVVANREREEAAPERRALLTLLPTPPDGEAA